MFGTEFALIIYERIIKKGSVKLMEIIKKYSLIFSVILIIALILSACGNETVDGENSKEEATPKNQDQSEKKVQTLLRVADTSAVTTLDPSVSFSTEVAYLSNIYEPLLWANPVGSDQLFTPALAEDWEHNDDGTIWTFYLRDGVLFHDGTEFNADAVKKSIERTMTLGKGAAFIWAQVNEIEVLDNLIVRFHLSDPVPFERIVSSGNGAWIMSPAVVDHDEDWFNQGNAAGTGPWKLESYKPDQEVILTRNEQYWDALDTNFEKVLITLVSEGIVQQQMLTAGEVDIVTSVPVENIDSLEKNDNVQIVREPSFYNFVGFFNTKRPPLDNKLVRQALSYAVPYDAIIEVATKGAGTQAAGPVPQGLWPFDESLKPYEFNIAKAKQLLDEAGVNPADIKLEMTYAAENGYEERFSVLVKEGFEELGVHLDVQPILWSQQWERAKGDPENAQDIFVLMWWPTYSDGYDNLKNLFGREANPAWNLAYWYNDKYEGLIDDAYVLSGADVGRSQKLYTEAQEMLLEEAPSIYFFDMQRVVSMGSDLKGHGTNPNYPNVIFYHKFKID